MYKITIKGEASTDYANPEELSGIDCQDEFSVYFDDDFTFGKDVKGGWMDFRYENGKLWTYTEYESNRLLNESELKELADYTQGQWSDGIGEGFEQEPCRYTDDDEEIYVSPWCRGQVLEYSQNAV